MFNLHFILVWSYILYLIIYITTKSILKDYRRCFHRWWTIKLSNIYFEGYPLIVLHLLKNNVVHVVLVVENPPGWFVNLNKICYEHLLVLPWSFKVLRTNIFTNFTCLYHFCVPPSFHSQLMFILMKWMNDCSHGEKYGQLYI